ncbi:MAG: flippase-like domain-containing protein [Chloroflexi bacterium]|nr:flippase-like domain-containing protein [Chloroflexota bacterium]
MSDDQPRSVYEPAEFLDSADDQPIPEREVSLARRFLNVRTIGSIVFAALMLFLLFRFALNVDFGRTWGLITGANLWLLLVATAAYYLTFPIRGFRWRYVLARSGVRVPFRDASEILFLSWFVNCLVPAKLGDLYRAYLLKGNYGASASRTVGTIFIERIADIIVIFGLALAAGYWSFRGRSRPEIDFLFLIGFVVAVVLVILVISLRWFGDRLTTRLPARVADLYARFREGSTNAVSLRALPVILVLTGAIWLLEGARLYFVIQALALPEVGLGISASVFVALAAALLTAIPLTPAGVGFVELAIAVALGFYGVGQDPAAAVAFTDRAISILTVIVLGGILYAFSRKVRRAHSSGALASAG